jgi:predicted ArsR family transcriptional regulator
MSKKKHPETSLQAWRQVTKEMLNDHQAKILESLTVIKKGSSEQISTHSNLSYWQVTKRMKELEDKELIYKTGEKVATRTGRSAAVYALKKPGEVPEKETESVMPGPTVSDYSKNITKSFVQQDLF